MQQRAWADAAADVIYRTGAVLQRDRTVSSDFTPHSVSTSTAGSAIRVFTTGIGRNVIRATVKCQANERISWRQFAEDADAAAAAAIRDTVRPFPRIGWQSTAETNRRPNCEWPAISWIDSFHQWRSRCSTFAFLLDVDICSLSVCIAQSHTL